MLKILCQNEKCADAVIQHHHEWNGDVYVLTEQWQHGMALLGVFPSISSINDQLRSEEVIPIEAEKLYWKPENQFNRSEGWSELWVDDSLTNYRVYWLTVEGLSEWFNGKSDRTH